MLKYQKVYYIVSRCVLESHKHPEGGHHRGGRSQTAGKRLEDSTPGSLVRHLATARTELGDAALAWHVHSKCVAVSEGSHLQENSEAISAWSASAKSEQLVKKFENVTGCCAKIGEAYLLDQKSNYARLKAKKCAHLASKQS